MYAIHPTTLSPAPPPPHYHHPSHHHPPGPGRDRGPLSDYWPGTITISIMIFESLSSSLIVVVIIIVVVVVVVVVIIITGINASSESS